MGDSLSYLDNLLFGVNVTNMILVLLDFLECCLK